MEHEQIARGELLIAGIGGMGIVTLGDIVARTALKLYKHVAWFPCYAGIMRGGVTECCVIFSSEEIASPLIYRSEVVIALVGGQIKPFEERVRPGGLMLLESSGLERYQLARKDIKVEYIPALDIAAKLGDIRNANLVMLGAYIEATKVLPPGSILEEIGRRFGEKAKEAFMKGVSLLAKLRD